MRARPAGVCCAALRICSDNRALAAGLVMCTSWSAESGASSALKAKAESSDWFQVPTPPASTPHMGRAPAKRCGYFCTRPAVMIPPSEWPQAIVRVGRPTLLAKKSSSAVWSWKACCNAQPVLL